jgi:hypothetical protein
MSLRRKRGAAAVAGLVLALAGRASAHEGPPYPIFVDRAIGPYTASLWADPDVGVGTFYVMFDPPAQVADGDPRVVMTTWPASGRLAPVEYATSERSGETHTILGTFDAEEVWSFRFSIEGSAGKGELELDIPVTPPGYGKWDLLIYGAPFLVVAGLWALVAIRKRTGWSPRSARG